MEQQKFQEEEEIDLLELFNALWAEKVKIIKYGFIAGVVGIVVALSIPRVYTTSAVMVPEMETNQGGGGGSLQSLASLAGFSIGGEVIGITADTYPQIVSSTPFIFEFADMPVQIEEDDDVYREVTLIEYFTEEYKSPWWSAIIGFPMKALGAFIDLFKDEEEEAGDINDVNIKRLSKDQKIYQEMFAEQIYLSMDIKTYVMTLTVNTQSPDVSLQLADNILEKLQEYMTVYKTSKTRSELESNQKMLNEAQSSYYRADSIYAAASDRARNITSSVARVSLDRLMNEKNMTFQIYNQLAAQVELNKAKLNAETPILTVVEPASRAIKPSSPNKPLIVVFFGFLGGVIASAPILLPILMGKKKEEEEGENVA